MRLAIYSPCVIAVMERYMLNEKIGGINCHQPPPLGVPKSLQPMGRGNGRRVKRVKIAKSNGV